jgi:V/A-type H+/Na+-transporting ATPase subunit D
MSAPTGRSGRQRLVHQVEMARRGAGLLDRKQRVLGGELARLRLRARRTREEWQQAASEAQRWLARSHTLDGAERIAAVASPSPAVVRVTWQAAMGVLYPDAADVVLAPAARTAGSSALTLTRQTHQRALAAAAALAAAERAHAEVARELESTRLRRRAIERRLLPRLEGELRRLTMQLDELDREENVRLRWASSREGPKGAP